MGGTAGKKEYDRNLFTFKIGLNNKECNWESSKVGWREESVVKSIAASLMGLISIPSTSGSSQSLVMVAPWGQMSSDLCSRSCLHSTHTETHT